MEVCDASEFNFQKDENLANFYNLIFGEMNPVMCIEMFLEKDYKKHRKCS